MKLDTYAIISAVIALAVVLVVAASSVTTSVEDYLLYIAVLLTAYKVMPFQR